jgi:hypothetical protein
MSEFSTVARAINILPDPVVSVKRMICNEGSVINACADIRFRTQYQIWRLSLRTFAQKWGQMTRTRTERLSDNHDPVEIG